MGGNEIDLREAEIEGGELTVNLIAVMGGANVYVPDSVELDVGGFSLMGGHEEVGSERRAAAGRAVHPDPDVQPDGRRDRSTASRRRPAASASRKPSAWPSAAERGELPAPG